MNALVKVGWRPKIKTNDGVGKSLDDGQGTKFIAIEGDPITGWIDDTKGNRTNWIQERTEQTRVTKFTGGLLFSEAS